MIMAYVRFEDVVVFDINLTPIIKKWAFSVFIGFNHFREIMIFDVALMCDQTKESFEWVFIRFLEAHGGKKPTILFTDQDIIMWAALEKVLLDTRHELCV
jgi:zinc finger SWIM domain-containing protein 3